MRLAWVVVVGLVVGSLGRAVAQDVRYETGFGMATQMRKIARAAKAQGRTDWLMPPYTGPGTQAMVSFDARNCDVVLITQRAYGSERLLGCAKSIAQSLGMPRADYIVCERRTVVSADAELNKYLDRTRTSTRIELGLARIADALRRSDVPKPVVLCVETEDADHAVLLDGSGYQTLTGYKFLGLDEVRAGTRLTFDVSLPAWAIPAACLLVALYLCTIAIPFLAMVRRPKAPASPAAVLDPKEIQRRYDRGMPRWVFRLIFPLIFVLPFVALQPSGLSRVMAFLPLSNTTFFLLVPALIVVPFMALVAGARVSIRRLERKVQEVGGPELPRIKAPSAVLYILGAQMLLMFASMTIMHLPGSSPQEVAWHRPVALALLGASLLVLALMPFAMRRAARANLTTLTDGPWFEMVHDMGRLAGVRVRKVQVSQFPLPNASASVFGTVTLTSGLLERLTKEEVRAVVAHEVGHLKRHHPQVMFVLSLAAFSLFLSAARWGMGLLPESLRQAVGNPAVLGMLVNVPVLLALGPLRRRRECEADRCAVEWVGDPDLVIRALSKVNQMGLMPQRLRPSDEILSTHPSLVNRARAIRAYAAARGIRVTEEPDLWGSSEERVARSE